MDENNTTVTTDETTVDTTPEETTQEETTPEVESPDATVKDLQAKLADLQARYQKMKVQNDKMSKAEAEAKRQAREGMTQQERELDSLREELERMKESNEELVQYKKRNEAKNRYLLQGMDAEMAAKAADAECKEDYDELSILQKQWRDSTVKAVEAEYKKSMKPLSSGTGKFSGMDKNEILAIENREERRKAIAENLEMFQ